MHVRETRVDGSMVQFVETATTFVVAVAVQPTNKASYLVHLNKVAPTQILAQCFALCNDVGCLLRFHHS